MAQRLGAPLADRGDRPIRLTPQQRRALKARAADLEAATEVLRALLRDYDGPVPVPAKTKPKPVAVPTRPDPVELVRRDCELYALVPLQRVPDDARWAAKRMLEASSAALGIRPPGLAWVAARGDPAWIEGQLAGLGEVDGPIGAGGFFSPRRPSTVYVRATDSPRDAAWLVAHELRHYQQYRTAGAAMETASAEAREQLERDADVFADTMLAHFGGFDD